jgi:hypothetical protein
MMDHLCAECTAHIGIVRHHSDRILLAYEEVGKTGGCGAGILSFVPFGIAVGHGRAAIDQKRRAEVGFGLVLFNIKAIAFRPHFPVEMPDIVARRVFPVLDKLDGMAKERAGVKAG